MKIKSYYSRSVENAMAMARQELGADAMLINSRKSPAEARHLGDYEVVFGVTEQAPPPNAEAPAPAAATATPPRLDHDRVSTELAELKKELEGMRRTITRTAFAPPQWLSGAPDLADAYTLLTTNDVPPQLAREIVQAAESRVAGPRVRLAQAAPRLDGQALERALTEELESRISVQPQLGKNDSGQRIAALVGPPGSGKTTTLVKLAVNYGLACRRPVMLLSVDNFRIGAAEQLRSYAAILGVGFQMLDTVAALAQAIEGSRGKDLILIDTPGLGFADFGESSNLARFISTRPDVDTHLVLSSSMKSADLTRMVDSYDIFRPQKLLFTRMDETVSFGPLLNEAVRTAKPVSFFAMGQRIPEDLEEATPGRLVSLLLTGRAARAQSAA